MEFRQISLLTTHSIKLITLKSKGHAHSIGPNNAIKVTTSEDGYKRVDLLHSQDEIKEYLNKALYSRLVI